MVEEAMVNKLQKILDQVLNKYNEINCCVEYDGKNVNVSYDFWVSSGGDMGAEFAVPYECTIQEILYNIQCWFSDMYKDFDEDEFVRTYMDMNGAPSIRTLLNDAEEVCNFYGSTAVTLLRLCSASKIYRETESDRMFTRLELLEGYIENEEDICESSGAENFWQYLNCCLTGNGTLEEIE